MRLITYYLQPESGYIGEYEKKEGHLMVKEGTVCDLIHDSKMLWISDYDKVIPDLLTLNRILKKGYIPRSAEWDSFEIDEDEYKYTVDALLFIQQIRSYSKK